MHSPRRAAAAAITLALALGGGIAVAHADDTTVLYVDGSSASCTDSGTGAEAAPYCTIQPAANAAVAGDTVDIEAGTYKGDVDVTSTGTAAAPIVFQAVGQVGLVPAAGQSLPVLSFDGASYVTFEGGVNGNVDNEDMSAQSTVVSGSSHITLDELKVQTIEATGTSSDVTISRDWLNAGGVKLDAGGSGDIVSTNWAQGSYISATDVTNTAITSNTVEAFGTALQGITVSGASTGVTLENNIVAYPGTESGNEAEISVDAAAAAGTTADYNVVWPYPDGGSGAPDMPYSWAGADYTDAAELYAATGQGEHDLTANPWLNPPPFGDVSTAPQDNSANSAAPGMLDTDMYGDSCTGDPIVAVSGAGTPAYCARGAVQPVYTTTVSAYATAVTASSASLSSTLSQSFSVGTNQEYGVHISTPPAVSYTVNWGDGTTETYPGSTTETSTADTHTYAKVGTYTITDTVNLTNGSTASTTTSFTTAGSDYTPYGPSRILDTRKGIGAAMAPVKTGDDIEVKVAGVGSIPADVTAVALNLTATDTTANGYLDAVPDGDGPQGSTLNYLKGQTVANNAIAQVSSDGYIDIYDEGDSGGTADILGDISGYFTPTTASAYTPATAMRLLDTRNAIGAPKGKIAAGSDVPVAIAGADSIPSGVTAVAVHVTVVDATGNGWIAAEADGAGTPSTSILNYLTGQTVSNTVIVPVAADGDIELYNGGASGSVDLLADVAGYFSADGTDAYVPIVPTRIFNSNSGGALPPDGTLVNIPLGQFPSSPVVSEFPANATMVTNLTVTQGQAGGYITVYPNGVTRPATSNLNYLKGQTVANLALLGTKDSFQDVDAYNNSTGTTDLIIDELGYFGKS
jgi:hypothetical protein